MAEFWEYDARLMRRWNTDPMAHAGQSLYEAFYSNPIAFADPLGLKPEGESGGPGKSGDRPADSSLGYYEEESNKPNENRRFYNTTESTNPEKRDRRVDNRTANLIKRMKDRYSSNLPQMGYILAKKTNKRIYQFTNSSDIGGKSAKEISRMTGNRFAGGYKREKHKLAMFDVEFQQSHDADQWGLASSRDLLREGEEMSANYTVENSEDEHYYEGEKIYIKVKMLSGFSLYYNVDDGDDQFVYTVDQAPFDHQHHFKTKYIEIALPSNSTTITFKARTTYAGSTVHEKFFPAATSYIAKIKMRRLNKDIADRVYGPKTKRKYEKRK